MWLYIESNLILVLIKQLPSRANRRTSDNTATVKTLGLVGNLCIFQQQS